MEDGILIKFEDYSDEVLVQECNASTLRKLNKNKLVGDRLREIRSFIFSLKTTIVRVNQLLE